MAVDVALRRLRFLLHAYVLLSALVLGWTAVPDAAEPFYAAVRLLGPAIVFYGAQHLAAHEERLRDGSTYAWRRPGAWWALGLLLQLVASCVYFGVVQVPTVASCPSAPHCDAPGETFRYATTMVLHGLLALLELVLLYFAVGALRRFQSRRRLPKSGCSL